MHQIENKTLNRWIEDTQPQVDAFNKRKPKPTNAPTGIKKSMRIVQLCKMLIEEREVSAGDKLALEKHHKALFEQIQKGEQQLAEARQELEEARRTIDNQKQRLCEETEAAKRLEYELNQVSQALENHKRCLRSERELSELSKTELEKARGTINDLQCKLQGDALTEGQRLASAKEVADNMTYLAKANGDACGKLTAEMQEARSEARAATRSRERVGIILQKIASIAYSQYLIEDAKKASGPKARIWEHICELAHDQ